MFSISLRFRKVLFWLILAVVILFFCSFLRSQRVLGDSMMPTLHSGEQVIVSYVPGLLFSRGNIVVVSFATLHNDEVKRLVALPGDVLSFDSTGHLFINGEQYVSFGPFVPFSAFSAGNLLKQLAFYNSTLPHEMYLVLGDNMRDSSDSRSYGFISREQLKGRVLFK